jgi:hypothetical protein
MIGFMEKALLLLAMTVCTLSNTFCKQEAAPEQSTQFLFYESTKCTPSENATEVFDNFKAFAVSFKEREST